MGTRGAFGYHKGGLVKAAYNHFDSYPEQLGQAVLDHARSRTVEQLNEAFERMQPVDTGTPPTPADIERWAKYTDLNVSRQSTSDWYCLMRKAQGDLAAYEDTGQMPNNADFLKDSLFCEWAYLVNLDNGTLEVYRGFNEKPPTAGIFAGGGDHPDGKYYPVNLIQSHPLADLPEAIVVAEEEDAGEDVPS